MIKDLREKLDKKEIGAVELCKSYLDRIDKSDKKINSFVSVCRETAIKEAELAQKAIDRQEAKLLTGIPVSLKDNISTKNIRTTCSSKMLSDYIPIYDATVTERLKENGAVILGKVNMDEFGMGSEGKNSYFGATHNPYNTEYSCGGSSSGSGASVAAKMCVASLGTDTGGSVRLPASFCGVTGLKPTYGTVSRYGIIAHASSLDQVGVISNSAVDAGYILNVISGKDGYDFTVSSQTKDDYLADVGKSVKGYTVGIVKEIFDCDDEVKRACATAIEFYKDCDCNIKEVSLSSLEYAISAYYLISSAEVASNLARYDGMKFGYCTEKRSSFEDILSNSRDEALGREVKRRILLGNYALNSGYKDALKAREYIKNEFSEIFKMCDFILTPTSPRLPNRLDNDEKISNVYKNDICTIPQSLAGLPCISTTCGYSKNGFPIGMSLTGSAFDEQTIIALADAFEKSFERREVLI